MSEYRQDIIGREIGFNGCQECELASHHVRSPLNLIYEDSLIIVHPHLFVRLKGFIVISPRRHVTHYSELTEQEGYSIAEAIERIKKCFKENNISETVNVKYVENESQHFQVWVVAPIHPFLENDINIHKIDSEFALNYYGIMPSATTEILNVVQLLKKVFAVKKFVEPGSTN